MSSDAAEDSWQICPPDDVLVMVGISQGATKLSGFASEQSHCKRRNLCLLRESISM